jgi:hypothetical protein
MAASQAELVRSQGDAIRRAMETQLLASVKRPTRRKVLTCLSGTSTPGSDSVAVWVLESVGVDT